MITIYQSEYDSYEGQLEARIQAFEDEIEAHRFTVGIPAPIETDRIEEIVRVGGGFTILPDPAKDELTPPAELEKPREYSKAQLFTEMTDEEFDLYEYISLSQPARERGIFEMTTKIQPSHALYEKFEQLILQAYGDERGQELLDKAVIVS